MRRSIRLALAVAIAVPLVLSSTSAFAAMKTVTLKLSYPNSATVGATVTLRMTLGARVQGECSVAESGSTQPIGLVNVNGTSAQLKFKQKASGNYNVLCTGGDFPNLWMAGPQWFKIKKK